MYLPDGALVKLTIRINLVTLEGSIEGCTRQVTEHIVNAAKVGVPKRTTERRTVVPWWNEGCSR